MIKKNKIWFFIFFSLHLFLVSYPSDATHIRAGEVIAKRLSGLTFEFTFFGYRDTDGVIFGQGLFDFGDGQTYGGHNDNEEIPWVIGENLGNSVEKWYFTLTHTYSGNGYYLVSYIEEYRNNDIQNIANSGETSFYVETLVTIDPLLPNSTPFFTVPPIDQGVVGSIFEHNPGVYDPDGDSLSYHFTIPKQGKGLLVNSYRELIDQSFYEDFSTGNSAGDGPPTLILDKDGTLIWDAPGGAWSNGGSGNSISIGEFNVAFVVTEWRKINGTYIQLGYVTRDMQIVILDIENLPPELKVPPDTCLVAGSTIEAVITATDPEYNSIKLEAFGGPFEIFPPASFLPYPPIFQPPLATLNFEWNTACNAVRNAPYEVQFKAEDDPGTISIELGNNQYQKINPPGLVNFETWKITVLGPPPVPKVAKTMPGKQIELSWESYQCLNADSIQVWRRVGSLKIDSLCKPGIPENAGFELIDQVDANEISYLDNNQNKGLSPGVKYCYRLVAIFPSPKGGVSLPSAEICDSLPIDVPILTHVNIQSTDTAEGTIFVQWVPPLEIDTSIFPPPYSYELQRAENSNEESEFKTVYNDTATFFINNKLNTQEKVYFYRVLLYDSTHPTPIAQSFTASSVQLKAAPRSNSINLNWTAQVPWTLKSEAFPYHYIYRNNVLNDYPDSLVLFDSTNILYQSFSYTDNEHTNGQKLDDGKKYCYVVTTQGSYENKLIPAPLLNASQMTCASPNDTLLPCKPTEIIFDDSFSCEKQLDEIPCGVTNFKNVFSWNKNIDQACYNQNDIFKIYYSKTGEEGTFQFLDETQNSTFEHRNLNSLVGCYYIQAVDPSGNIGETSEIFCRDNCPRYILPNVITPNGDGINDFFQPFDDQNNCPRFVKSVVFKVFNSTGTLLFTQDSKIAENTIYIQWSGVMQNGEKLPFGVYYYAAIVDYERLSENTQEIIKGWIQILY